MTSRPFDVGDRVGHPLPGEGEAAGLGRLAQVQFGGQLDALGGRALGGGGCRVQVGVGDADGPPRLELAEDLADVRGEGVHQGLVDRQGAELEVERGDGIGARVGRSRPSSGPGGCR